MDSFVAAFPWSEFNYETNLMGVTHDDDDVVKNIIIYKYNIHYKYIYQWVTHRGLSIYLCNTNQRDRFECRILFNVEVLEYQSCVLIVAIAVPKCST